MKFLSNKINITFCAIALLILFAFKFEIINFISPAKVIFDERKFSITECTVCDENNKCFKTHQYTEMTINANEGSLIHKGNLQNFPDTSNSEGLGYEICNIEPDKDYAFKCKKSINTQTVQTEFTRYFDGVSKLRINEYSAYMNTKNTMDKFTSNLICKLQEKSY